MAIRKLFRVKVSTFPSLLVLSCLTSVTLASFCPNNQYFNSKQQRCLNCTDCEEGLVVLRPCEFHRNTHCGPIRELIKTLDLGNPHRHKHMYPERHRERHDDIVWRYGDDVAKKDRSEQPVALEVSSSEAPFSGTETLVWDWQAVALTSAVFVCILFFLVITLYSLHQAKQWRRLKENFEADVEELSARLSLMAASSCSEKGEFLTVEDITDPNYLNGRCVYLEQLLSVRKDEDKIGTLPRGNVYIEENNSKT